MDTVVHCTYEFCSAENGGRGRRRKLQGFPSAPCQLPPVTAESSVRHAVWSQVLDQLWSEVVTILAPLVLAARDRALKGIIYSTSIYMYISLYAMYIQCTCTLYVLCMYNVSIQSTVVDIRDRHLCPRLTVHLLTSRHASYLV